MYLNHSGNIWSLDEIDSIVDEKSLREVIRNTDCSRLKDYAVLYSEEYFIKINGRRIIAFEYKGIVYVSYKILDIINIEEIKKYFSFLNKKEFEVNYETLIQLLEMLKEKDKKIPGEGISECEFLKYTNDIKDKNENIRLSKFFFENDIFCERLYWNTKHLYLANQFIYKSAVSIIKQRIEKRRIIKIAFISFKSKWHEDVWNVLSIESLKGHLQGKYGDDVEIIMYRIGSDITMRDCIKVLNEGTFDFLGISLEIGTEKLFNQFMCMLEKIEHKMQIVIGGVLVTYYPHYFAKLDYFKKMHIIGMIGEGELGWSDLIRYAYGEIEIDNINNLVFYANNDILTFTKPAVIDENELIYSPTIDTVNPNRTNILQFSRGCIFSCNYCSQGPNKRWRALPISRCVQNLCALAQKGVHELEFVDDEFLGGRTGKYIDRLEQIKEIFNDVQKKYNNSFSFRIFTNPLLLWKENDDERNRKMESILNEFKEEGLSRIYLGMESGSLEQRKRYNRKESIKECEESIRLLRRSGIESDIGFIMFDPEMSVNDIRENVLFFKKNNLIFSNTWPFRPLIVTRNVPIYFTLKQKGLLYEECELENILSIKYRFESPEVNNIYQVTNKLAKTSDKLFYNVKYLTKRHNDRDRLTKSDALCWEYVRKNAMIYLDLLEKLSGESADKISSLKAILVAIDELQKLVSEIKENLDIICLEEKDSLNFSLAISDAEASIKTMEKEFRQNEFKNFFML